jgi:hypothetical protein
MKRRRLLLGGAAVLIYLFGAVISSWLSPFGAAPILDGLSAPPPYRWVKPPADLSATNKKPFPGKFSLRFTGGRSEAGAFTTRDSQLSMILDPGAITPHDNPSGARIDITPLAASSVSPPAGYTVDGNVYRITITETPSGAKVTSFVSPQRVILVYPADKSFLKPQHILATSSDGKSWTRLKTQDSNVQQQSSALLRSPGLVAVITPNKSQSSNSKIAVYAIVAVAILLIGGAIAWWLRRRPSQTRRR